jgi:hypothetical protein
MGYCCLEPGQGDTDGKKKKRKHRDSYKPILDAEGDVGEGQGRSQVSLKEMNMTWQ